MYLFISRLRDKSSFSLNVLKTCKWSIENMKCFILDINYAYSKDVYVREISRRFEDVLNDQTRRF